MYLVLIGIDRSEYRRASTASDACVQIQAHKTDKIRSRNIEHIIISSLLATVEVGKRSCERDLNALLIKCQQGSVSLPALSKTFSGSLRGVSEIVGRMIERLGIVGRVHENFWKEVTLRTCYLLGWGGACQFVPFVASFQLCRTTPGGDMEQVTMLRFFCCSGPNLVGTVDCHKVKWKLRVQII